MNDLIDCVEYLKNHKYADPDRVAGTGEVLGVIIRFDDQPGPICFQPF